MTATRRKGDSPAVAAARLELRAAARGLQAVQRQLKAVAQRLKRAENRAEVLGTVEGKRHTVEAWLADLVETTVDVIAEDVLELLDNSREDWRAWVSGHVQKEAARLEKNTAFRNRIATASLGELIEELAAFGRPDVGRGPATADRLRAVLERKRMGGVSAGSVLLVARQLSREDPPPALIGLLCDAVATAIEEGRPWQARARRIAVAAPEVARAARQEGTPGRP